jgi:hypothetical protein
VMRWWKRCARPWVILLPRLLQNKHSHNRTGHVG